MNQHPSHKIMNEIINRQWKDHSIYAAIVNEKMEIITTGKTTVSEDHDPTAHAEINAIRSACKILETASLPRGYWLYSTFEPCPLCSAAAVWAGLDGIVYANDPRFKGSLPNWSFIKCRTILKQGRDIHHVQLIENFMLDKIKDYFTRHL
ncbi:nucleoside deaminase [Enterococcus sp. AZ101]|uniref:nucleoside deaminase n=1 Tax=Enterococcus sp. AZ101 TaxID=2774742 RepID=UPI003D29E76A